MVLTRSSAATAKQLAAFQARVAAARRLPAPLKELFASLPKWTPPMDARNPEGSNAGSHFVRTSS